MGVTVSSSHGVSAASSSSGGGLLLIVTLVQHGVPLTGDSPSQVLQRESLPWATVLHELLQCSLSHGVQTFRSKLLQHGSPTGSQVLPANLPWRGLLSPRVHRSCQDPAPAWASHRVTASFGCLHLLRRGFLRGLQVESLHPLILPPWAAGGQPASPWSSAGGYLLQRLEHLLPLLLH